MDLVDYGFLDLRSSRGHSSTQTDCDRKIHSISFYILHKSHGEIFGLNQSRSTVSKSNRSHFDFLLDFLVISGNIPRILLQ